MSQLEKQSLEFAKAAFDRLHGAFMAEPYPSYSKRKSGLLRLKKKLQESRSELQMALFQDLGKSAFEAEVTDYMVALMELNTSVRQLDNWMRREPVSTPIALVGTHSYISKHPKGVVLIVAPWNYPILLSLAPLISAYAAGNKIMLKPSEHAPASAKYLQSLIASAFAEDEVQVVLGGPEVGAELVNLPFNHIFYTGGIAAAKKISRAAAENLTPLTLELGGKSPVLILEDADVNAAARNVAFAKSLNSGQTCLAPDYVWIPSRLKHTFIEGMNFHLRQMYGSDILASPDYAKMINEYHFNRVCRLVNQSLDQGAVTSGPFTVDPSRLKIHPTLLTNVTLDMPIMQEEIFGPVLPIMTYGSLDDVLQVMQLFPRPLACYLFGRNQKSIEYVLKHTRSGGVTINNCLLHYGNIHLPFGGEGHSGYGQYHGKYGFDTFSHARAVTVQSRWFEGLRLLMPPSTKFKVAVKNLLEKIS